MFERNRIDSTPAPVFVAVELTLASDTVLKGRIAVPNGRAPADAINGQGGFIEFESYAGHRRWLAKSQIAEIEIVSVAPAPDLAPAIGRSAHEFDPHEILGVAGSASWEEVRAAYVQLAKTYHPDRYSNAELPDEVKHYLETMSRRVNAAYAALEAAQKVVKTARIAKAAPIYTSQPRA